MSGNSTGTLFKVTTFGESHGRAIGAVIDGCPSGLLLAEDDIQPELDRRRPGQSAVTTDRREEDTVRILSGVFEGRTTGAPICLVAENRDARSADYEALKDIYRPSHADLTYEAKYGVRDWRGGGRSSARETFARVAAGAVAAKFLRERYGISVISYVESMGEIAPSITMETVTREQVEESIVRCPDRDGSREMGILVSRLKEEGDSVGGVIRCLIRGVPRGVGEPVFDKLHADLGKGMLSINAVKGFEIGSGFDGCRLRGSEHNDEFEAEADGTIRAKTNRAGGVLGGIASGETIWMRIGFKPTATIRIAQETVSVQGKRVIVEGNGRHDPCVLPRAVPVVDAMASLVIIDHLLRYLAYRK